MEDAGPRTVRDVGSRGGGTIAVDVSPDRMARRLDAFARFTDPALPFTRRAFTSRYQEARAWLAEEMRTSGLAVRLDAGANLMGVRVGTDASAAAWMVGSHSDTVPAGGRFDGVAGVVCALEVADALGDAGLQLQRSLHVVDFLSEEPSDYGPSCVGSRAWVGTLSEDMLTSRAPSGETLEGGIRRMGGDPEAIRRGPVAEGEVAGFLELHVEQGRVLEQARTPVGLVDGIVAVHRHAWLIEGEPAHAGTTPMSERRDALLGAAMAVEAVHERALHEAKRGSFVATVGRLDVTPNGINVVPGAVDLVIEIRALEEERIHDWYVSLEQYVRNGLERLGLTLRARLVTTAPAMRSDPVLVEALRGAARALGHEPPSMVSGAGHDAMQVARRAPAAMLFVPSRAGISHTPEEHTDLADLVVGAKVLLAAVLQLDATT